MKTFVRLIRRYVLAAVGVVVLLMAAGVGLLAFWGWRSSADMPRRDYAYADIADAMTVTDGALAPGAAHTPEEWLNGYAWAMVLDDDGRVIWQHGLPAALDRRYTPADVARFTRWYLADYPVFCQVEDYGLFVIALPQGSLWKYSVYASPDTLRSLLRAALPQLLALLAAGLGVCFVLSWLGARRLQRVAAGLDALADGQPVTLPTDGFTGELADKLNRTSAQLQTRNEIIARRDNARTQWVAGVSHDVRTPLALILGWAEQLEHDAALPDAARTKAGGIRTQSERLRALIEDLNLTSKLQYGAQPLRREPLAVGPLLRALVAEFCDSPPAANCEVTLTQTPAAEQATLSADRALLGRLVENLLSNSVRHNPPPVHISVLADVQSGRLVLTVADDGAGYPPAVLAALHDPETDNAPHILGLHVVEQIAAAHGGEAVFTQNTPRGAKAVVTVGEVV